MIFDVHAHYDDEAFDPDRETLLKSLPEKGVARTEICGAIFVFLDDGRVSSAMRR